MKTLRYWLARTRTFLSRGKLRHELEADLEEHRAMLEEKHRARGLSPEDARLAATRDLGNLTRAREQWHEQAGFPALEDFIKDLRFALRGLLNRPLFALSIVLILALGLGVSTCIHSYLHALLFRPLPVENTEELYRIATLKGDQARFSAGTVRRLEEDAPGLGVIAYSGTSGIPVLNEDGSSTRVRVQLVNSSFFSALGLRPIAGRNLSFSDKELDNPRLEMVVTEAWAKSQFGTLESVVGRVLKLRDVNVHIVGVMPDAFRGVMLGVGVDAWLPMTTQALIHYRNNYNAMSAGDRPNDPNWNREERVAWLNLLLRVSKEAKAKTHPLAAVTKAFSAEAQALSGALSDPVEREALQRKTWALLPSPGGHSWVRDVLKSRSMVMSVLVASLMTLACANVSGLLLLRCLARHREIGVRLALGSGRWRICRLILFETLLLCLAGAALGMLLAYWTLPIATNLLSSGNSNLLTSLDWHQFLFAFLMVLLVALGAALIPALTLSRLDPQAALAGRLPGKVGTFRSGRLLVLLQLTVASILVTTAWSLERQLAETMAKDPGFARSSVLSSTFDVEDLRYSDQQHAQMIKNLERAILRLPGVEAVGFSFDGILMSSQSISGVFPRGTKARVKNAHGQHDSITPGYLEATGMVLLRGRPLTEQDSEKTGRVTVVNQHFARELFGSEDVVGERFGFGLQADDQDWTIVGVVADAKVNSLKEAAPSQFFTPASQWANNLHFVAIKFKGGANTMVPTLSELMKAQAPGIRLGKWMTLEERMRDEMSDDTITANISGGFAVASLLLAAIGLGSLIAYLVLQRRREYAIRMAVGADPRSIKFGILKETLSLALIGAVLGGLLFALLQVSPAIRDLTNGFSAEAWGASALLGIFSALLAGLIPARQAARSDLLSLLKSD